ncbi:hypothetical protein WICPIJ_009010 [Wickerhamomyces pijperi]|uniref:Phosphodiesterase n=1 Tax=Wickerhamomyces pijperi TaxID=599730 RepID=A0A9P8PS09_WICPI|nr:hypothetical protein WICPIJ_009010 [Wickerhamomyces pijperi]
MSQVIYLDGLSTQSQIDENTKLFELTLKHDKITHFHKLTDLITYVSITGASELDVNYPYIIIVNAPPTSTDCSSLNFLGFSDIHFLLKTHYKHLNTLVYSLDKYNIAEINQDINNYHDTLKNRIMRMKTWCGLNNDKIKKCPCLHSMTNCINLILQNDPVKVSKTREFSKLISKEIDFYGSLTLRHADELEYYKYCIGNWGFIAHDLTCDELTYCALLIFKQCFDIVGLDNELILSDNEVLCFLFSLRDSYRGGNAFHNFRHAVDVLQATFYFLVRIGALPAFREYTEDLQIHPEEQLKQSKNATFNKNGGDFESHFDLDTALLHPIQTLALLVASVGHDVGHPGLTNQFMNDNGTPISKIYSGLSTLENYHSTIFQDILTDHWPIFLNNTYTRDGKSPLNTSVLQVDSIIATDMANHFEYIQKIDEIHQELRDPVKRRNVKNNKRYATTLLSLIIKCADISNVTRPLSISIKWGVILTREFSEIALLTKHLKDPQAVNIETIKDVRKFAEFPEDIAQALEEFPRLYDGQLFFINTFADSLFTEAANVLPELGFSKVLIDLNKEYWISLKKANDKS